MALITSIFHHLVSLSMREDTMGKSPYSAWGEITLWVDGVGNRLSFQIWIRRPLPTLHLVPLLITSRLLWMLHQAHEGLLPILELRTSSKGKYFALKTRATRESGFVRILQSCLASMARLKACMFLKPIPPWSLDQHIFLQLTHAILFSLSFCPHQKLLIILSKSWQRVLGS